MRKKVKYDIASLNAMIDDAKEIKTVSAVIVIAMSLVAQKDLSQYAFAGLLRKASDKIYSISEN